MGPAEFVAARNALAKKLKADGHRDEAAAVAALRRPTVPDWALNSVALQEPDVVADARRRGGAPAVGPGRGARGSVGGARPPRCDGAGSPGRRGAAQGGRGRAAAGWPAGRRHERPHDEAERDDGAPGPALPAAGRPAGHRGGGGARSLQRRAGDALVAVRGRCTVRPRRGPAEPRTRPSDPEAGDAQATPTEGRARRRAGRATGADGRPRRWSDAAPRPPNESRRPTPSSTRRSPPCTTPRPR